jgi:hypothetical protein
MSSRKKENQNGTLNEATTLQFTKLNGSAMAFLREKLNAAVSCGCNFVAAMYLNYTFVDNRINNECIFLYLASRSVSICAVAAAERNHILPHLIGLT